MPTFTSSNYSVSALASELIYSALREINVYAPSEAPSAEDAAFGLEKLQRIIDQWNARWRCIYNVNFARYTVPTNQQPVTIGPSGDFNVPIRPVKLVAAALVLTNGGSPVDLPIAVQDDAWWAQNQLKSLTSTLFTDVYYSPDIPLGKLYFWPIPTQSNDVRLETWTGLAQAVDLNTSIGLPAAYWDALIKTLARDMASTYGPTALAVVGNPVWQQSYREAMKAMQGNNAESPRIATQQAGMPSGGRSQRPDFNFLTGKPW